MTALMEQHQRWSQARSRLGLKPPPAKRIVIPAKRAAIAAEASLRAVNDDCPLSVDKVREAQRLQRRGHTLSEIAGRLGVKRDIIVQLLYWDILATDAPRPSPEDGAEPTAIIGPIVNQEWKAIINEVCQKHGLPIAQVLSGQRSRIIVRCRHEIMYRLSRETSMSLPSIGRRLGRDHTSVMHGIRKHIERAELGRA